MFQLERESIRAEIVTKKLNVIEEWNFVPVSDQRMEEVKHVAASNEEQRMLAQVAHKDTRGISVDQAILKLSRYHGGARQYCL